MPFFPFRFQDSCSEHGGLDNGHHKGFSSSDRRINLNGSSKSLGSTHPMLHPEAHLQQHHHLHPQAAGGGASGNGAANGAGGGVLAFAAAAVPRLSAAKFDWVMLKGRNESRKRQREYL